jgi:hypothetical protein
MDWPLTIALVLFLFLPAFILIAAVIMGVRDADKKSDRDT